MLLAGLLCEQFSVSALENCTMLCDYICLLEPLSAGVSEKMKGHMASDQEVNISIVGPQ